MAATTYDILIVGSGASGGMAAHTLTQKGVKCLVLEAGPMVDFDRQRVMKPVYELPYRGLGKPGKLPLIYQATEFNANQWVDEEIVPYTFDPKKPYSWARIRMIGGKSLFWARMSYRLSDYEFKAKDHDGFGENWPISYADLAPYYDRVEPILRVTGRNEGLPQLPDGKFVPDESPDGEILQRIAGQAKKLGTTVTKIRRALGDGQFASSRNLLLPAAYETGNLTIVPNAVVRAVTTDKKTGKANGVSFFDRQSGREFQAKARVVVLGASCLESTRILLNSNIANSSGVLGHYWHDQYYIPNGVVAVIPEARNGKAPRGLIAGGGIIPRFRNVTTREKNFLRGYACDVNPGQTPDAKYFSTWGAELEQQVASHRGAAIGTTIMAEVLPRFENHVRLDPKVTDAWGIPVLNFHCQYGENEHHMAKDAINTISQMFNDTGCEILHQNTVMNRCGRSMHELGTCRMGDNPKTSVLNKWNQSHDVKNLFVMDGSSFVTGGAQNPTLTIMALAMRSSEYLAEQLRRGDL
ncbi:MAG: GMC family oxidoreductase [Acidobacteria bacterium]|nr:GMC family oxidoreductase [Acidobacteriota bacterium]